MLPVKFSGHPTNDLPWRVWSKKAAKYIERTFVEMGKAMRKVQLVDNPVEDLSAYEVTEAQDMQLGQFLDWVLEGEAWEIYDGSEICIIWNCGACYRGDSGLEVRSANLRIPGASCAQPQPVASLIH